MVRNHNIMVKSKNGQSNEKLNVLRLLIENPEKEYSIRKIALEKKINYKSAYEIVKN